LFRSIYCKVKWISSHCAVSPVNKLALSNRLQTIPHTSSDACKLKTLFKTY